jgi:hypothetical protein
MGSVVSRYKTDTTSISTTVKLAENIYTNFNKLILGLDSGMGLNLDNIGAVLPFLLNSLRVMLNVSKRVNQTYPPICLLYITLEGAISLPLLLFNMYSFFTIFLFVFFKAYLSSNLFINF